MRLSIDLKYIQPPDRFWIVFIINFRQRHNSMAQASLLVLNNNLQKVYAHAETKGSNLQNILCFFVLFTLSLSHIQFNAFVGSYHRNQFCLVASIQHLREIAGNSVSKKRKGTKEEKKSTTCPTKCMIMWGKNVCKTHADEKHKKMYNSNVG